jgi:hypothetical protein
MVPDLNTIVSTVTGVPAVKGKLSREVSPEIRNLSGHDPAGKHQRTAGLSNIQENKASTCVSGRVVIAYVAGKQSTRIATGTD